ncbi:hypothetical protein BDD12DRAFT_806953 [Trichophaea hybrida]|nr:hypothetical protein BDD12DRAFT_806953 [Trichophaea hybrida]
MRNIVVGGTTQYTEELRARGKGLLQLAGMGRLKLGMDIKIDRGRESVWNLAKLSAVSPVAGRQDRLEPETCQVRGKSKHFTRVLAFSPAYAQSHHAIHIRTCRSSQIESCEIVTGFIDSRTGLKRLQGWIIREGFEAFAIAINVSNERAVLSGLGGRASPYSNWIHLIHPIPSIPIRLARDVMIMAATG